MSRAHNFCKHFFISQQEICKFMFISDTQALHLRYINYNNKVKMQNGSCSCITWNKSHDIMAYLYKACAKISSTP